MLAPIDAVATVEAGGDTITLTLNFRTLALCARGGVDLLAEGGAGELDVYKMATVIAAFAKPAHPDFTDEDAFALLVRHGTEASQGVTRLLSAFSEAASGKDVEAGGKPDARPQTRRKATA